MVKKRELQFEIPVVRGKRNIKGIKLITKRSRLVTSGFFFWLRGRNKKGQDCAGGNEMDIGEIGLTSFMARYKTENHTSKRSFSGYLGSEADKASVSSRKAQAGNDIYSYKGMDKNERSKSLFGISNMQETDFSYTSFESKNYRIIPDNENGCFDIFTGEGERIGAFLYSDIKIRQDQATGTRLLISEYGTGSFYNAIIMDEELENGLMKAMGVESLEKEVLQGYQVKKHAETGIKFVVKDGEEGRGGRCLLATEDDRRKYEELAETYCKKYPNLVKDKNAGYFWASNEIRGLALQSGQGILSVHYDGMSYSHNSNDRKNWCIKFSGNTYKYIYEWIQNNRGRLEEMQKFAVWDGIFADMGSRYERIWSREEELQGYLNQ